MDSDKGNRTASGWSEVRSLGSLFKKSPIMRLTASAANIFWVDAQVLENLRNK